MAVFAGAMNLTLTQFTMPETATGGQQNPIVAFTFNPLTLNVPAPPVAPEARTYVVTIILGTNVPGVALADVSLVGDGPALSPLTPGEVGQWSFTFESGDVPTGMTRFGYRIGVATPSGRVTSSDPEIVLGPPG